MSDLVKLTVDGVSVEVPAGTSILQACETAGAEIPRFCYHERLSVAGNCRMCLVEVERAPKPVASCAMPVAPDMVVHTGTDMVKDAREGVMEFLLINHPLDCPICDQGGECDLQDQALGYGHDASRFADNKRAVEEKFMGPLVKTEMTRCIHCTRCVRFSTEVAGVPEIGAIGRGEDMEITTYLEASLDSELSGNVIDLCPVGALTSKPYAFTARPWELRKTETIDVMDAVGSSIRVDARGREVMRILPRNHDDVNEEWISDKSRFVWDGINRQRLDRPYLRAKGKLVEASWSEVFEAIAARMGDGNKVAALAGDLACVESQYALKQLMTSIGSPHMDCRPAGSALTGPRANYILNSGIAGIEEADGLLLIGVNPRLEASVINARIRKRWRAGRFPIAMIGEAADLTYPVENLGVGPETLQALVKGNLDFSKTLAACQRPMIILGEAAVSRADGAAIFDMALDLAEKTGAISGDWNGFGVLHNAAGRVGGLDIGFLPTAGGRDTAGILQAAAKGDIETVFLLGADELEMDSLGSACVIYIGSHGDAGAARADIILPAACYTEKQAIYVNTEGRVQMTERATLPPGEAREDWKIFRALSAVLGKALPFDRIEDLRQNLFAETPHLAITDDLAPAGQPQKVGGGKIATAPFGSMVRDFYFTNPVARASITMAQCAQARAERQAQVKGTGTNGN
jgi:NADH-quinone oxidoreductase subunit G